MTTRHLVGSVIAVHTETGRLILKIAGELHTPMLSVIDSAGNEFAIEAGQYEYASAGEVAQFTVARLQASKASQWN